jgi:hypothetical protein
VPKRGGASKAATGDTVAVEPTILASRELAKIAVRRLRLAAAA